MNDSVVDSDAATVSLNVTNVTGFTVNGGNAPRSRVTSVVVTFATPVNAAALQTTGAITFTRTAATSQGTVGTAVDTSNGLIVSPVSGTVSSVTLTFANVNSAGANYGSLADGRWQLAIPSANYSSTLGDTALRRLFGDSNNDGTVDAADFSIFGTAFGTTVANNPFDDNNDGAIQADDFAQFGNRFGVTL